MSNRSEPLRVLYVDAAVGFGGAVRSLSFLLSGLRDVEPIVITSQTTEIAARWYRTARVHRLHRVLDYRTRERLFAMLDQYSIGALLRFIAVKGYAVLDVLQTLWSIAQVCIIAMRYRVRIIHSNTGFTHESLNSAHLLRKPCVVHCRGLFTSRRDPGIGALLRLTTRAIGVSRTVSESICDAGLPTEKAVTIYNPVDLDAFDRGHGHAAGIRARLGIQDQEIAVGVFGRVVPGKGHIEFVEACLAAMRDNGRIRGVIVGDGSDGLADYFAAILSHIKGSDLGDRFILAGYQDDVEGFYAAMDIVVNPASNPEMFGLDRVIGEGMAAARPVIATTAGGPRELIESGVDGILVTPGDVTELSLAIAMLAADPDQRAALGTAARRKAGSLFGLRHVADQVLDVYRTVLTLWET